MTESNTTSVRTEQEEAPGPSWAGSAGLLSALERLPVASGAVELLPNDMLVHWLNPAAAAALGLTVMDVIGKKLSTIPRAQAGLPGLLAQFRAVQLAGKTSRFERQIGFEAGTSVYATTVVHLDANRFFFISEDVTRRTSLEQLLRAGEAKYRAVFTSAREAIALFNFDSLRCVEANDAFVSTYGWSRYELREVTMHQLGDRAQTDALAKDVLARGSVHLMSGLSTRKDGTTFPSECDVHLIHLGERRVLCFICHDLSAQRQLQEKLLLADRFAAVGTLAAGVAHEVNNPLAYLLANLTFLAERLPELDRATAMNSATGVNSAIDELRPALREAITGAQRVKEIVNDLKTFSRPELPGGLPVDLAALLDSVLRLLQNELKRRAVLVREIGPLPRVLGHEPRLAQVFLHVLNNAVEALPDRPPSENRIRVSAHARGNEVEIEIEDNGAGIPEEQQRRVFDPFFTTRPIGNGTGLGLAVCHGIVTALGGRIELTSAVGRGTTVHISLPRAAVEKGRPTSDPMAIAMPTIPRLLVIDDEPMLTDAVRRMMMGEADVVPCLSVDEGIALLARGDKFDAILCDLHLTGRGGISFHEELTRSAPALAAKLGFITGGATDEAGQTFIRKHADRVLDKPFSRNALRALVKSLIT